MYCTSCFAGRAWYVIYINLHSCCFKLGLMTLAMFWSDLTWLAMFQGKWTQKCIPIEKPPDAYHAIMTTLQVKFAWRTIYRHFFIASSGIAVLSLCSLLFALLFLSVGMSKVKLLCLKQFFWRGVLRFWGQTFLLETRWLRNPFKGSMHRG